MVNNPLWPTSHIYQMNRCPPSDLELYPIRLIGYLRLNVTSSHEGTRPVVHLHLVLHIILLNHMESKSYPFCYQSSILRNQMCSFLRSDFQTHN